MADIAFRSAYSPAIRVPKKVVGESMTQQNFQKECDVNRILEKYQKTGLISHLNENKGSYENFVGFDDYHTSMNMILEAQEAFNALPADVRKKFGNDPAEFMEFVHHPDSGEEMVELGLARRPPFDTRGEPTPQPHADGGPQSGPVEGGTPGTEGDLSTVTEGSLSPS